MNEIHLLTIYIFKKKKNFISKTYSTTTAQRGTVYAVIFSSRSSRIWTADWNEWVWINLAAFSATLVGEKGLSRDSNSDLRDAVQCFTSWAMRPTGSWSLRRMMDIDLYRWFLMHEIHVFEQPPSQGLSSPYPKGNEWERPWERGWYSNCALKRGYHRLLCDLCFVFRLLALCLPAVSCVPLKRNMKWCKDFTEESRPCCNWSVIWCLKL